MMVSPSMAFAYAKVGALYVGYDKSGLLLADHSSSCCIEAALEWILEVSQANLSS